MELLPREAEAQAMAVEFRPEDAVRLAAGRLQEQEKLAIILKNLAIAEQSEGSKAVKARREENDRLYSFQVPQLRWEGTQVPRASLGMPLVLEHINSLLPQIMDVLFEEDPPFYPLPYPGTPMNVARAVVEVLNAQLDKANFKVEMEDGLHECLLDGEAFFKSYWGVENGYKCFKFEHADNDDVFVDPSLRRPDVRRARWLAHRIIITPDELDKLRNVSGYSIPSRQELILLGIQPAEPTPRIDNDSHHQSGSPLVLNSDLDVKDKTESTSFDPRHHKLELMEYYDFERDQIITVLGRKKIIRELDKASSGTLWTSIYFIKKRGTRVAIGIAALIGNEQKIQQALINGSLDALSLSLNVMLKKKKSSSIFPQQVRVAPGKVLELDDVNDLEPIAIPGPNPQAFDEIDRSDSRASRRTGANEAFVQGAFPDSTGGTLRTASGVNELAQAVNARTRRFVGIIEEQVIVPVLEWVVRTNLKHLNPAFVSEILGESELAESFLDLNAAQVIKYGSKFKFKILTPTKMKRRAAMLQAVPQIIAFFQQDSIAEQLKSQYKKLNFSELVYMMFDATGWPNKTALIQDMSQDEIAQVMSENEMLQQLMLAKLQIGMQSDAKIKETDAKQSGQGVNQILKAMLEKMSLEDQQKMLNQQMQGEMLAQQELQAEQSALGL